MKQILLLSLFCSCLPSLPEPDFITSPDIRHYAHDLPIDYPLIERMTDQFMESDRIGAKEALEYAPILVYWERMPFRLKDLELNAGNPKKVDYEQWLAGYTFPLSRIMYVGYVRPETESAFLFELEHVVEGTPVEVLP